MSDDTHDCPITGCTVRGLPRAVLMCRNHWRVVPRGLQRLVYGAFRARSEVGGVARHLQACEDAIAAVEGRDPRELFDDDDAESLG